jgi:Clp amino terminal domain, pathogenicity island component
LLIRDRNGGAATVLRQLGVSTDAIEEALWPCVAAGPACPRIDPDALATLGMDFEAVRERLVEKFGPARASTRNGCLGVPPRTKQALAHADGQPLGDERILLGMLTIPDSLAAQILGKLGVSSTLPRRSSRAAMSNSARDGAALSGARWRLRRQPSGPGRRHVHTFAEARAAVLARTCSRRRGGTGPPRLG